MLLILCPFFPLKRKWLFADSSGIRERNNHPDNPVDPVKRTEEGPIWPLLGAFLIPPVLPVCSDSPLAKWETPGSPHEEGMDDIQYSEVSAMFQGA